MRNMLRLFFAIPTILLCQIELYGQKTDVEDLIVDIDSINLIAQFEDSLFNKGNSFDTISNKVDGMIEKSNAPRDSILNVAERINDTIKNELESLGDSINASPIGKFAESPLITNEQDLEVPLEKSELIDLDPPGDFVADEVERVSEEIKIEDLQKPVLRDNLAVDEEFEKFGIPESIKGEDSISFKKITAEVESQAEERLTEIAPEIKSEPDYFNSSKAEAFQNKSKYFQSKEEVSKEIMDRFKALGYDNPTAFQDKIKDSQEKLAKYKKKYSEVSSVEDLDKKPVNPMKDKSLKERIIWGGNFQIHRKEPYGLDLSPHVAFKFTRIISAGIGGTYRLVLNANKDGISSKEKVYGSRSFVDFEVYKGFALHIEYEQMRMVSPPTSSVPVTDKMEDRTWIRSGLVGIKKSYSISKKLLGNAQILYNLVPDQKILSPERIVFRVGFEIVPSEKKKKEKE